MHQEGTEGVEGEIELTAGRSVRQRGEKQMQTHKLLFTEILLIKRNIADGNEHHFFPSVCSES